MNELGYIGGMQEPFEGHSSLTSSDEGVDEGTLRFCNWQAVA
jgi:hypothetical protein